MNGLLPLFRRGGRYLRVSLPAVSIAILLAASLHAQSNPGPPTVTILTFISGGNPVTTVAPGSVVTLSANVSLAGDEGPYTAGGLVTFCDAAAKSCTDIHFIGQAPLSSSGTATLKIKPGNGSHSYYAVFPPNIPYAYMQTYGGSTSAPATLQVGQPATSTTSISQSGSAGNYTLTATVAGGNGEPVPAGTVSFLDTTNNNSVVATAPLANSGSIQFQNTWNEAYTGYAIAAGDFNGDGVPDYITQTASASTYTVWLGKGDGTFTAAAAPSPAVATGGLLLADFNGDGFLDAAVLSGSTITVLLGKGDGTFSSAVVNSGLPTGSAAVGDFNGDGILDLAVLDDNAVAILLGNGDGTFTRLAAAPFTGIQPSSIVSGDFNNDGNLDLVVTNDNNDENNTLTVLLGNGDGTFTPGKVVTLGDDSLGSTTAGDFNQDGNLDLALLSFYNQGVQIMLGDGKGGFTAGSFVQVGTPTMEYGGSLLETFALGDFNGDDIADLMFIPQYALALGNGDGTFSDTNGVGGAGTCPLAVADFNGDGLSDVVTNCSGSLPDTSPGLSVYLSQGGQSATAIATAVSPIGTGTHNIIASFPGNNYYAASQSSPVALTTIPFKPAVTVTPSSAYVLTDASSLTLTVTVKGSGPAPTGTVAFPMPWVNQTGSATLSASGVATFSVPAAALKTAGTLTFTASYQGDSNYAAESATTTVNVESVEASIDFTVSTSTAPYETPITLTAQLTGNTGTALSSGSVNFFDGSIPFYTATLSASGSASYAASLSIGQHSVTAVYSGAPGYAQTQAGPIMVTVTKGTQTIVFAGLQSQLTYGVSPLTLSATATSGLPVSFTVTGPATINGETLTITGAGTVVVTAQQPGNATYNAAPEVSATINVLRAPQTIAFTALHSPLTYGVSPRTLSATATSGLPVTFTATGPGKIEGGRLSVTGAGEIVVTAHQPGNANYNAATEVTDTINVLKAPQTIDLKDLHSPLTYGVSPRTLSATASSSLPVKFTTTGPAKLDGDRLTITGVGTIVVTAHQPGNADHDAAPEATDIVKVDKAAPEVRLKPSAREVESGKPVTITVTVSGTGAVPTGEVHFHDSATPHDTISAVLNASGTATDTHTPVTSITGTHTMTAIYSGDNNYQSETSAAVVVTVTPP